MLRAEIENGEQSLGKTHYTKAVERARQLRNLLSNSAEDLCPEDRATATELLSDLEDAQQFAEKTVIGELAEEGAAASAEAAAEGSLLGELESKGEITGEDIGEIAIDLFGDEL
jgi:hypothetical protein